MRLESGFQIAPNWLQIEKMIMTSQFSNITSLSIFFDVVLFLLSNLVTGPSSTSISSLFLELWKFSFIRDCPEIWKMEIPPCEFSPISGDWSKIGIPMFGTNVSYKVLLKAEKCQDYSFYCFWIFKEKSTGRVKLTPPTHPC